MFVPSPSGELSAAPSTRRLRIACKGAVQGVGFRPFIFRLACELELKGWVKNTGQGAIIEVEGEGGRLAAFLARVQSDRPPRCIIHYCTHEFLEPAGYAGFHILNSAGGEKRAWILPDVATCAACLREVFDPGNRRYLYPFTNCTNCGPRFSIVEALPYDRSRTSMKRFPMCGLCQAEYDDPANRRFHAQPNACPKCGPRLELWNSLGESLALRHRALLDAANALKAGGIVAVKGIGGFHLMADALNDEAVKRLRAGKRRAEKPFALMCPSLTTIQKECLVTDLERSLLRSPAAPIVLLERRRDAIGTSMLSASVAPGNPNLGIMLPYSPLHSLLMRELAGPVVATSGNLAEEPIAIDEHEALRRLNGIADLFLVHDRPIMRQLDDSVVRAMAGRELMLRRSRGYAPLPFSIDREAPELVAVGAHQKNTVALFKAGEIFSSQHIGDLDSSQAMDVLERESASLERLYDSHAKTLACDLHPDYASTLFARRTGKQVVGVQHHQAHILSCMVDNEIEPPVLGVAWDGTGLGIDGTLWGGEFLHVTENDIWRSAFFRPFHLPGGQRAIREPARTAIGMLYELFGGAALQMTDLPVVRAVPAADRKLLKTMLARKVFSPLTSSVGRLFDGVAAIVGICMRNSFEGQAAMALEFALEQSSTHECYPLELRRDSQSKGLVIDWQCMLIALLHDLSSGTAVKTISAKFHNALAEAVVLIAVKTGEKRVVLSGGCFQNRYLTERIIGRLRQTGFKPYWHRRIPPNDGGIAVGQILGAVRLGRRN